ncbi:MAG TPA: hypothetical protein VIM11_02535 [Tepidisphaeraceae bacterium]
MNSLDNELLRGSIEELVTKVDLERQQLDDLRSALAAHERELTLLRELLTLRGEHVEASMFPSAGTNGHSAEAAAPELEKSFPRGHGTDLNQAVAEIIREHGRPVAIQDLVEGLRAKGVVIPGQGNGANVIAHISRSAEIVRTQRGIYGLKELGHKQASTVRNRTKRKVAGRKRTARAVQS